MVKLFFKDKPIIGLDINYTGVKVMAINQKHADVRGISEEEATAMIINGFMEPITKELPMEYAVELNQLINMSMEGSVG